MINFKEFNTVDLKKTLEYKLNEINTIIREESHKEVNIGLINGLSGVALFQFYYAKFTDNDTYADWGQDTLIKIIEKINNGNTNPTLSIGLAGAGWVFDHLNNEGFIELDNDELLSSIDNYLFTAIKINTSYDDFDFLHGSLGIAFYFLKRYNSTRNIILKQNYKSHLDYFIRELTRTAIQDPNGVKWVAKIKSKEKNFEGYNLSLAHGISSIISFLSEVSLIKVFKNNSQELLKKAISYVLSYEISEEKKSISLFPNWVLKDGSANKDSRLAWCYGDFGIALSIIKASKALNDEELYNKAIEILNHTTSRNDNETSLVVDTSLCHGAFGNAQIYNSIYHMTKNNVFKESATFWIESGLQMCTHSDGFAGFKHWYGLPEGWKANISLLEGVSGIGLSMIDYLSEEANNWDTCLLIK